jgi:hypothetical protein
MEPIGGFSPFPGIRSITKKGAPITETSRSNQRTGATETGSDTDFQGNFFIRRPGRIDLFIPGGIFQNFGTWCARVSGGNQHAGFVGATGDRFVPGKNYFLHNIP